MDENPQNDSTEELTALEVLLAKWEPAEVKIDSVEKRVTFERFATKSHYLVNSGIFDHTQAVKYSRFLLVIELVI